MPDLKFPPLAQPTFDFAAWQKEHEQRIAKAFCISPAMMLGITQQQDDFEHRLARAVASWDAVINDTIIELKTRNT